MNGNYQAVLSTARKIFLAGCRAVWKGEVRMQNRNPLTFSIQSVSREGAKTRSFGNFFNFQFSIFNSEIFTTKGTKERRVGILPAVIRDSRARRPRSVIADSPRSPFFPLSIACSSLRSQDTGGTPVLHSAICHLRSAILLLLFASSPLSAATYTWQPTSGNGNWSTVGAGGWDGGPPGAGDTADIAQNFTGASVTITLDTSDITLSSLIIGDETTASAPIEIYGGASDYKLIMGNGTITSKTVNTPLDTLSMINAKLSVDAGQTLTVLGSSYLALQSLSGVAVDNTSTFKGKWVLGGATTGFLLVADDKSLGEVPGGVVSDAISIGRNSSGLYLKNGVTINSNRGISNAGYSLRMTVEDGGFATYNGVISGTGSFTEGIAGASSGATGILHLGGLNTYTGNTYVRNDGTLEFDTIYNVSGGASSLGAPTTVANGTIGLGSGNTSGTIRYVGAGSTSDRVINLLGSTGNGTIDASGTGALVLTADNAAGSGGATGAKTLTLTGTSGAGLINQIGKIVNNSFDDSATSVTKTGSNTWELTGANTYTGATTVSAGILRIGAADRIHDSSNLVVNGGTLALQSYNETVGTVTLNSGSITGAGGGALTGSSYAVESGTISAILAGAGINMTKSTAGTVTLSGANTYTGTTTVTAGTITLGASNVLHDSSDLTLNGGTFSLGGSYSDRVDYFDWTAASNLDFGTSGTDNALMFDHWDGTVSGVLTIDNMGGSDSLAILTANKAEINATFLNGVLVVGVGSGLQYGADNVDLGGGYGAVWTRLVSINDIYTWNGGGGNDLWNNGSNWGGSAPAGSNTTSVVFGSNRLTPDLNVDVTVNSLLFASDAASFTVGGANTLTFDGTTPQITQNSSNAQDLGVAVTLNQDTRFAGSGSGVLTVSGAIGGVGGIIKTSSGTLVLSNTGNNYGGTTTISSGTLKLGAAGVIPNGSALTVNGTFDLNGYDETVASLAGSGTVTSGVAGSKTLTAGDGSNTSFSGVIQNGSGTVNLTKAGAGTLTLSNTASTYTGVTTINAGTISVSTLANGGSNSGIGASTNAAANLVLNGGTLKYTGALQSTDRNWTLGTSGGTFDASGTGALTLAGTTATISGTGTRTLTLTGDNSGSNTLAAVIGDDGSSNATSLTKSGTGTWVLSGANTYTGATTVSGGTLKLGAAGVIADTSALSVSGGATFDINNNNETVGSLSGAGTVDQTGANGRTLTIGDDNTSTSFTGELQDTGGGSLIISKTGSGTLTLSGANAHDGSTAVTQGVLNIQHNTATGTTTAGTTVSSGAALQMQNGITVGAEALTISGSGVSSDGALRNIADINEWQGAITLGVVGTNRINSDAGTLTLSGGMSGAAGRNLTVGGLGNTTISGVVGIGTGSLTKDGSGTLTLSHAANTYTGPNTINAGTISVSTLANGGSNSGIGASTNAAANLVLNGGTLKYTGGVQSTDRNWTLGTGGGTFDASGTGALTLAGTTPVLSGTNTERTLTLTGTSTHDNTLAAVLANNGTGATALTKSGAGTWVLTGANTYTGTTTVSAGTLKLGAAGRIADTSAVSVTGTLDMNNYDETVGSLTGGGLVTNSGVGSKTLTVGGDNSSTAWSGVIENGSGTMNLTKQGSGTMTISGNNTYTGTTTISAGTLALGASDRISNSSNLVVGGGTTGKLDLAGFSDQVGTLSYNNGTIDFGAAGALLISNNGTQTGTLTIDNYECGTDFFAVPDAVAGALGVDWLGNIVWSGIGTGSTLGTTNKTIPGYGAGWTLVVPFNTSYIWDGSDDGDWDTAGNWVGGLGLGPGPGCIATAVIFAGSSNTSVTIDGDPAKTANHITFQTGASSFALGGAGPITLGGNTPVIEQKSANSQSMSTPITLGANLTISGSGSGSLTLSGIIDDGGSTFGITQNSTTSKLILSGANSFYGAVAVNAGGIINLQHNTGLGNTTGDTTVASGGALELQGGITVAAGEDLTITGTGVSSGGALRNISGSNSWAGLVTLGGASTIQSDQDTLTITGTVGGGQVLTVEGAGNVTITGRINTATSITKNDGGTLTIGGANAANSTGNLTINGGIVDLAKTVNSAAINLNITVNDGGTLRISGSGTDQISGASNITFNGASTLDVTNGGNEAFRGISSASATSQVTLTNGSLTLTTTSTANYNFAGNISGSGGITIAGNGGAAVNVIQTFSGNNTYFGDTVISSDSSLGASRRLVAGSTTGFSPNSKVVFDHNNAKLDLGGFSNSVGLLKSGVGTGLVTSGAAGSITITVGGKAGTNSETFSGVISDGSGTVGLTVNAGDDTQILSGTNTYTGTTTVTGGTLQLGASAVIADTSNLVVNGGTFALQANNETVGTVTLNSGSITGAGGGILTGSSYAVEAGTISAKLAGAGAMTKTTASTVILSGDNSANYTGTIAINAGTLSIAAETGLGGNPGGFNAAQLTINGGTLAATETFTIDDANRGVTLGASGGTISVADTKTLTVSNAVTGAGSLTKSDAGTLTLGNASNDYGGATLISAGTLKLGTAGVIPNGSALTVTGTLDMNGQNETVGSLAGAGVVTSEAAGDITLTAGGNDGTTTYSGAMGNGSGGGTLALTKTGTGTLTLSGTNTYTGATTINAGTLRVANGAAIADTSAVVLADVLGAALDLNNSNETVGSLAGGGTTGGNVTLGSGTLTAGGNDGTTSYGGAISGSGGLTKEGAGILTLSGSNTYTGATTISAGTLKLGAAERIADTSAVSVTGTLDMGNFDETIGSLAGGGTVTNSGNGSKTLTAGGNDANTTFSGAIGNGGGGGAVGLTKAGAGTMTLSGTNTYTGMTTVNAGTLQLGASDVLANGSALTVNGGTFALQANNDTVGGVTLSSGSITGAGGGILTGSSYAVESGTVSAILAGAGVALTKTTGGTVTLSGANTYTGATTVSAGTISLGANNVIANTSNIDLAGGTLNLGGSYSDQVGTLSYNNGTLNFGAAGSPSYFLISDDGTVTGTLTISNWTNGADKFAVVSGTALDAGWLAGLSFGGYGAGGGIGLTNQSIGGYAGTWDFIVPVSLEGNTSIWDGGDADDALWSSADNWSGNVAPFSDATLKVVFTGSTRTSPSMDANYTLTQITFDAGASTFTLGGGNTITIDGATRKITQDSASDQIVGNAITLNGGLTVDGSGAGSLTISGAIGDGVGTFGIAQTSTTSKLILSGNNSFDGVVSVDAGAIVNIQHNNALGSTTGGTTVASGGVLEMQNNITVGAEALQLNGSGISSGGALRNISGTNEWQGAVTLAGATRINSDADALTVSGNIGGAGQNLTVGGAGATTITGVIGTTTGTLTKDGAGTLILTNDNTYTGVTAVSNGVLNIQHATATGTTAGGVTVASGAALEMQGGITVGAETLQLNGTGVGAAGALRNISGTNEWQGDITLAGATRINSDADSLTLSGAIGGAGQNLTVGGASDTTISGIIGTTTGTLTKDGAGVLTLSGANSYTGTTTITAGTIKLGAAGVIHDTSAVTVTGTLDMNNFDETIGSLAGAGTVTNAGAGAKTLTAGGNDGSTTFSGAIGDGGGGGSVALTKAGTGTMIMSGGNTYTGATAVSAGVLNIQHNTATGTTAGGVTVASGAALEMQGGITVGAETLQLNGTGVGAAGALRNISGTNEWQGAVTLAGATRINSDAGSLALSGNIGGNAQNLTVGGASDTTISGVIGTTTGTLTKDGAGILTLSGNNTYSGTTTISAGTVTLGASDRISNSSNVDLAGGTLNLAGSYSEQVGTLSYNGGTLDFGAAGSANHFLISDDGSVTGTLTISNWTTGVDYFAVANGATLDAGWLAGLEFGGYAAGGALGLTGQVIGGYAGTWDYIVPSSMGGNTFTWDGGSGANAQWNTGANWSGDTAPTSGNSLEIIFTGSTRTTPDMQANYTLTKLTFDASASAFTLSGGNAITVDGATRQIVQNSASNQEISNNVQLNGNTTFKGTGAGALTVSGIISGAGTLTKSESGSLILSGNNATYDAGISVSAGVLNVRNNNALGTNVGNTAVASGAALEVQGGITLGTEPLSLSGDGISSGGALRNITGDNAVNGPVTLAAAARINSDSGTLTVGGNIGGNAQNLTVGGAGNTTISGVIGTTTGTLTKDGAGTAILGGNNTYTGATAVSAGTLQLNGTQSSASYNVTGGTLMIGGSNKIDNAATVTVNGGILAIGANSDTVGAVTLTSGSITGSGGTLTSTSDFILESGTISAILAGADGTVDLIKNTAGTVTITGTTAGITGSTTINAGKLITANGNLLPGTVTNNATLEFNKNGDQTYSGDIGGTGVILKTGTATLVLDGTNTYAGGTTITGGTVEIADGTLNANLGSGAVNLQGGTLKVTAVTDVEQNIQVGAGNGTFQNTAVGTVNITGGIAKNGNNIIFTGSGITNIGGAGISGVADVLVDGGTLNYAVAQAYNGPTLVYNGGELTLGAANVMPNAPRTHLYLGYSDYGTTSAGIGTFTMNDHNDVVAALTGNGTVALGAATLTIGSASNGSYAGTISGTGNIIKDGAGTQIFSGANLNYSGTTTVSAGTLRLDGALNNTSQLNVNGGTLLLGAANRLGDATPMTLAGGTFNTGGYSETVGALTLTDNSAIDFGSGASSLTFASMASYTAGRTFTIYNWSNGTDHWVFTNAAGVSQGMLDNITFNGYSTGAQLTGTEIIPLGDPLPSDPIAIPEADNIWVGLALVAMLFARRMVRRRRCE